MSLFNCLLCQFFWQCHTFLTLIFQRILEASSALNAVTCRLARTERDLALLREQQKGLRSQARPHLSLCIRIVLQALMLSTLML